MDWNRAIDRYRTALIEVLSMLAAMAGWEMRGPSTYIPHAHISDAELAEIEICRFTPDRAPMPTLPRHLHRAIMRLLRPAEYALRRLVVIAARGLVVTPSRPSKPKPRTIFLTNRKGTGILRPRGYVDPKKPPKTLPTRISLPMFDPPRHFFRKRQRRPRRVPHICVPGITPRYTSPVRYTPLPDDRMDARRLVLRLDALGRALHDLPARARRYASWRARRDAAIQREREARAAPPAPVKRRHEPVTPVRQPPARPHRLSPLRFGRLPGACQRPRHEVHFIVKDLNSLAHDVLEAPDTS